MAYSIVLEDLPKKYLKKLTAPERRRLGRLIDSLASDPRPAACEAIETGKKSPTLYRIRSGNHRIVYLIQDDRLLVLVVRIANRGEVYRELIELARRYRP